MNLAETRGWVERTDPDAHDWTPFVAAILASEGNSADAAAIESRMDAVRQKVVGYDLGGCSRYLVGDQWFPSAELTQDDVEGALESAGVSQLQIWRFDTPLTCGIVVA